MPLSSLQDLERFLLEQELVSPAALQDCRSQLGTQLSYDSLLKLLEQRSFLTSYQAQKLGKRDPTGLRLGRYKLLYRNASGSFARVFRGCSVDGSQTVAIKVLRDRHAEDPRSIAMFRREGELGKRLKHKNIVPIYEVASDGNQHYLTMEFVEGGNFRDFIKIRKKFSVEEATKYVLDIAEGLEYALRLGLTHRDLKLSNVLLSAQGVAKLVDFGLAGQDRIGGGGDVDRAIEYATLERATGAPENDPRSDLYFLGAIYYELLTGAPPYPPTKSLDERRQFSRYRDVRDIRQVDSQIPEAVAKIVDRLMNIDPHDRFQTPTAVVSDLRHAIGQAGLPTSPSETSKSTTPELPTLICVENRQKHQDALREYFSKHGYRVLMLTDPIRALHRLDSDSVAALLLISDVLGDETPSVYQAAVKRCQRHKTAVILAVSPKQSAQTKNLEEGPYSRILRNSATLRSLRMAVSELTASKTAE